MTKRLAVALVALLAGVAAGPRAPVLAGSSATHFSVLQVQPYEGHSGDTFYVSGSGYQPFTQIIFFVACPRYDDYHAGENGNIHIEQGPITNAHGDFAGFPIQGFQLHKVAQSPCVIYANYQRKIFVSDLPALYYIVPDALSLRLAHEIHGIVKPSPKRVRAGFVENIAISHGWGGAMADVSVYYPHRKARTVHVRLNWRGEQHLQVPVAASLGGPSLARVRVHFHLGSGHGDSNASFTVVR